jgi:ubiquinone/menaquinone biosynthesis C-methylase UbiE
MFPEHCRRGLRRTGTTGTGVKMPGICFRMMAATMQLRDRIRPPERILDTMGIGEGMCVVDYGCGPGSYIRRASELAGERGHVFAVDIHELAIASVAKRIEKDGLGNVTPVLAEGYHSHLPDRTADLVYALDMFFMVDDSCAFLEELRRIAKPDATLIIDDGHQPREKTRSLIRSSGAWVIEEERGEYLRCRPARG